MVAVVFNHTSIDDDKYLFNKKPFVHLFHTEHEAEEALFHWNYLPLNNTYGFRLFKKEKMKDGITYNVLAYITVLTDYRNNAMITMLEDMVVSNKSSLEEKIEE
jgi:hypothetical protein